MANGEENPVKEIKNGKFEGEVWLSTDGKNTVRFKAETLEGRSAGSQWAKDMFEAIQKRYGTKQAQAVREYGKENNKEPKYNCDICGAAADHRSGVKNDRKWAGIFCSENKDHVRWITVK